MDGRRGGFMIKQSVGQDAIFWDISWMKCLWWKKVYSNDDAGAREIHISAEIRSLAFRPCTQICSHRSRHGWKTLRN